MRFLDGTSFLVSSLFRRDRGPIVVIHILKVLCIGSRINFNHTQQSALPVSLFPIHFILSCQLPLSFSPVHVFSK